MTHSEYKSTASNPQDSSGTDTILLAVTGMSPAILTETIWALAHEPEPVLPKRVIAVTTTSGKARLTSLFEPAKALDGYSPWDALRTALQAEGHDLHDRLRFGLTGDDIRVIAAYDPTSGQGVELDDIRDGRDNESAANFLLEQVRAIVENPDTQLVASVAGGRKTMSALLYACLTLVGREFDRLTHVLVSEPYETLPGFWFPAQPGKQLTARDGSIYLPSAARLDLADVPFVPLRNLFERELGRKAGTFSRLVEECRIGVAQRAAESLKLTVDSTRAEIEVNGIRVRLSPLEFLLFLFLAERAKHGENPYAAYKDACDDINAFRVAQTRLATASCVWRQAPSLVAEWDEHTITKATSGIRNKLRHAGTDAAMLAACLPRKGECGLLIAGPLIYIR